MNKNKYIILIIKIILIFNEKEENLKNIMNICDTLE